MARQFRVLDAVTPIALGDFQSTPGNVNWHQLALVGKWGGHWQGAFSVDAKDLDQMELHATTQIARGVEVPVDYGHATLFDREAPASGWIKAAQVRPMADGQPALYGQIAWTDKAAAAIRAGEYKYLSPTIQFHAADRVSRADIGTRLHSVALTNTPFLHELPEVRLNSFAAALGRLEEDPVNEEQRRALAKALGLSDNATHEEIITKVAALAATEQQMGGLFTALGVKAPEEAARAILTLKTEATKKDDTRVAELTAELSTLKAAEADRAALAEVTKAQAEGKVLADGTPNHKASLDFARKDLEGFKGYMASMSPISPVGEARATTSSKAIAHDADGKPLDQNTAFKASRIALSELERETCRLMGINEDDVRIVEAKHDLAVRG